MPTTGDIVGTEKKLEENKMFKKLKDKKGFTLVELIVVLVILAILAALLVPALTGYIDKAKNQSIIAETRQVVMATQTLADEAYGKKDVGATITYDGDKGDIKSTDILALAEAKGTIGTITFDKTNKSKIATLTYTAKGKTCTYTATPTDGKEMYEVAK